MIDQVSSQVKKDFARSKLVLHVTNVLGKTGTSCLTLPAQPWISRRANAVSHSAALHSELTSAIILCLPNQRHDKFMRRKSVARRTPGNARA